MTTKMKRLFFIVLSFFLISGIAYSQNKGQVEKMLIPIPTTVNGGAGYFMLNNKTQVHVKTGNKDAMRTAEFFVSKLSTSLGHPVKIITGTASATSNVITFELTKGKNLGSEGYQLTVNNQGIKITADQPAGLFYGMQTLFQLMPKEIEAAKKTEGVSWQVPSCEITDIPRFGWRGLMLDVSRHFFTKEEVKDFIDQMVKYKFNVLHWHLTDDQGWRIEIKGWPRLTEFGAWNVKKEGYFGTFSDPKPSDPRDYGGFYTQEDIKEVVQYAKDRNVDIVPEIDVPAHSLATVGAYPELSCTAEANTYQVNSGEPFMDWSHGAPPIALKDNTLCPANEKVYQFLDDVFTQVAQLFPFEYIHTGGDEAPHNYWEKDPQIQKLMKKEGLKDMNEVQSYFTKRVEKIVSSKGKKLIGWDEILEGGLAPNAAVMSWRGVEGGIRAAKMGHEVVMSPTTFAYLDYMQGDPAIESRVYAALTLKKSYEFDPLPEGVDPKFIKGGQGNLWTEQIYNTRYLQYMLWPRAFAVAEATWSQPERRDWKSFSERVQAQFPRLDEADVKYAPSMFEPKIIASRDADKSLRITLWTEIDDVDVHYSFDNSFPDNHYPKYETPMTPPVDAVQLKLAAYKGDKQVGRFITISIKELKDRADGKSRNSNPGM